MIEQIFETAAARQARVVMPEIDEDERMAEAARQIEGRGLAEVIAVAKDAPEEDEVAAVLKARPKANEGTARRMLARPLFRAGAMVAAGRGDALLAGAVTPTKRVIEAASLTIGPARESAVVSSFFLMLMPDGRALIFADCGLNVAPDAQALTQIALNAAQAGEALLGRARVAMLSFSTLASGAGESVDLVRAATEDLRAAGIDAIGPVQGDAALNPAIAARKGIDGPPANTLVFPSLDAGNIAYKLMQELGGAQAMGPVLQGFAKPVCDLSRGARVDDIITSLAVTLALGAG